MDAKNLDKLLSELSRTLGDYRRIATIGGGIALMIYREYLGDPSSAYPEVAATDDFDLLLPRELEVRLDSLDSRLRNSGFRSEMRSHDTPPVESYFGVLGGEEISIEFLTDRRVRGRSSANVVVGGVSAQPLSYIELSLEEVTEFCTSDGSQLRVVTTERWMFHKLLTFPKRSSRAKRAKDLYGIWYAGSQLGVISSAGVLGLRELMRRHSAWAKTVRRNVRDWLGEAAPDDWRVLERQDVTGNLTEAKFRRFVEETLGVS